MTDGSHMNGDVAANGRAKYSGNFALFVGNSDMDVPDQYAPPSLMASPLESMCSKPTRYGDGFLYDPVILRDIPWSLESQAKFKGGISTQNPGEDLTLRPLHINDYHKGMLDILAMLTSVGSVSEAEFRNQFDTMRQCHNSYFVTVIEDKKTAAVIGCATLLLEYKFIHSAGVRGRIEDVVVSDVYRGRQLGKLLLETLTLLGREFGCYKMSLECKDSLIEFYGQFGYEKDDGNNYLQQRFKRD